MKTPDQSVSPARYTSGLASRILAAMLAVATGFPAVGEAGMVSTGSMSGARTHHTASSLSDGRVLVAGGFGGSLLDTAEIYNPTTATWSGAAGLATARQDHSATLLPDGKLLVAGGNDGTASLSSAEVFDLATGTWSNTGDMLTRRAFHTATLLQDGKLLVAGGSDGTPVASAEIYDPVTGSWSETEALPAPRAHHTATLLPDGKVLVTGGIGVAGALPSAHLFDPISGTWLTTAPMVGPRNDHTATLLSDGKVLVAGGSDGTNTLLTTELYDPAAGTWTPSGLLPTARTQHSATLLPNGNVFIAGGFNGISLLATTAIYQPSTGIWSTTSTPLGAARSHHSATLLPNGRTLITGGANSSPLASAQLYEPSSTESWNPAPLMVTKRTQHTATLLPDGRVLVAGGQTGLGGPSEILASASLYDGGWSSTGSMGVPRIDHTATLLPNGKVLVAGGWNSLNGVMNPLASATLYDPVTGTWTATGTMPAARYGQTATLLANGKVLIAGGYGPGGDSYGRLSTAVVYDSSAGTWSSTANMRSRRALHTATLLPGGKVLLAGGHNYDAPSSELYDPVTGTWSATTGEMFNHLYPRVAHVAVLLPSGKVLVAAGEDGIDVLGQAELYDPTTGTWSLTGSTTAGGNLPSATLLPNGKVLLAGGNVFDSKSHTASYDPATGIWQSGPAMSTTRFQHTSTLLPTGKLLIVGGRTNDSYPNGVAGAELYDPGLNFSPASRPQLTPTADSLGAGDSLTLTGFLFRGVSGASGGNVQDSSSNHPVVQLRALDSGRTQYLRSSGWSATGLVAECPSSFVRGWAMVTVFVNGIPSVSTVQRVGASASLAGLEVSAGTITPAMATSVTNYVALVPGTASAATLTPTTVDPAATVRLRINDGPFINVSTGSATAPLALPHLENPVEVEVTSIEGMVKTYHLTIAKAARAIGVKEEETVFFDSCPPALDFKTQRVGQPTEKILQITNDGEVDFTLGAITVDGTNAAEFVAGDLTGMILAPGESAYFPVTFTPTSTGVFSAALHIESDADELTEPFDITLVGEAFIPEVVFDATGSLATPRRDHTATRLDNGKLLVAAGRGDFSTGMASSELYDPVTETWSQTGALASARYSHTAVLLANGKVLVCGGTPQLSGATGMASAELYDPATGTWSATGSLANGRYAHTATLLDDGKVLVAGGRITSFTPVAAAEIYDPATGLWSPAGNLVTPRFYHSATRLSDGRVLAAGGSNALAGSELAEAEIYDPVSGLWTATGSLANRRRFHSATALSDGSILVAGGDFAFAALDSAERYLPASGTWTSAGTMAAPCMWHTATLLPDGTVLVAGGIDLGAGLELTQRYQPATGSWEDNGYLRGKRGYHSATLLQNGMLLVAGGSDGTSNPGLGTAEVYNPAGGNGGPAQEIFNDWATDVGLTGPAAAPDATPFNDGVPNLLKYAFNMNAGGPDVSVLTPGGSSGLPKVSIDESGEEPVLRVEFLRRKGSGLIYTPQRSATLDDFVPMTGTQTVTPIDDQWERVSVEEAGTPSTGQSGFARVQVSLP